MWELNEEEVIKKTTPVNKKTRNNINSLMFLLVVVVSTISMFFYNSLLEWDIEVIKTSISNYELSIKEVEKDKKIQIFSLLELNQWLLNSYKKMNKISTYINHMNVIQAKYDLKFEWFNLSNWKLVSAIEITSDDNWIAYQKTRDFIKNYRTDNKALFDLGFINQVEWMDDMKFKVSFEIKN